jgi:hypothetical protein
MNLEMPKRLAEVKGRGLIPASAVRWIRRRELSSQLPDEWWRSNPEPGWVLDEVVLNEHLRAYHRMCEQFKAHGVREMDWRNRRESFEQELAQRLCAETARRHRIDARLLAIALACVVVGVWVGHFWIGVIASLLIWAIRGLMLGTIEGQRERARKDWTRANPLPLWSPKDDWRLSEKQRHERRAQVEWEARRYDDAPRLSGQIFEI